MFENNYESTVFDTDDIVFELDSYKDAVNFEKHGIRFSTAVKVFLDPDLIIREDLGHSGELRFDAIGKAGKILFVVYTVKENNTVRLISARRANSPTTWALPCWSPKSRGSPSPSGSSNFNARPARTCLFRTFPKNEDSSREEPFLYSAAFFEALKKDSSAIV